MKMIRSIILAFATLFAALALTGCATKTVDRVVTKIQPVFIQPEATYLAPTVVPAPPAKQSYAEGEVPNFEELYKGQVFSSIGLYKSLHSCNTDKAAAIVDMKKKRKAYE